MKYKIACDEWWPVYSIDNTDGYQEIELTDEEYQKIKQAFKDFNLAQKIIKGRRS